MPDTTQPPAVDPAEPVEPVEPADPADPVRTLVLLRHAKAVQDPVPDHERPLARRGVADAAAVGRWFVETGTAPQLVLCSSSVRTRETWAELARAGVGPAEVSYDRRVYDADESDLLAALADVPDDVTDLLVVGHAPGIPDLADLLVDRDASDPEAVAELERGFPTSCFARLEVHESWSELRPGTAELVEVAAPRG